MEYIGHILIMLILYYFMAIAVSQVVIQSGMMSLCMAMFYGFGAYTYAICLTKYNMNIMQSLLILIVITIIISALITYLSHRLRDLYFSLATLCIQIIFFAVAYNWTGLTGGAFGLAGVKPLFEINLSSISTLLRLVIIFIFIILNSYCQSSFNDFFLIPTLIKATRDDEIAFRSLGKSPWIYKFISISFATIILALCGAFYAGYSTYIDPSLFTLDESILLVSIVLISRVFLRHGILIGAFIYIVVPEIFKFVHLPSGMDANLRMIIFALTLLWILKIDNHSKSFNHG